MRSKLLLSLLLFSCGILNAQDTIRTLMITESRMDRGDHDYVELTNMGTETINLSDFEFGTIRPWSDPWVPEGPERWMILPDVDLAPGECYVIASFGDYTEEQYKIEKAKFGYSPRWAEFVTKPEFYKLADLQIHRPESPTGDPTDSITLPHHFLFSDIWNGRECWYVRQVTSGTDTINTVIDQVGGVFDVNGRNSDAGQYDVAGVEGATANSILVRRYSVKKGNLDFDDARGVDLTESEWIPIPFLRGQWEPQAAVFWTVHNHGNYTLDDLTSSTLDWDIDAGTLNVPWGVRNDDSLIYQFDRIPGIAWHYDYHGDTLAWEQSHEDSAYVSVRTGDVLTIYACGDSLQKVALTITVVPPTVDANIVVPKKALTGDNDYDGAGVPWGMRVSDGIPGMDTISEIPFGTRVDSLLKYLEKAPNASWAIDWVDDMVRTDLKNGDKLVVTAENGTSVKEYYIKVERYRKALNANLAMITWPDIPDFYRGLFGWMGDTVPSFDPGVFNYRVMVPWDVDGIPALVAKTQDQNAKIEVQRAVSLSGNPTARTVTFNTTAEDDTTELSYTVLLDKEKDPAKIQPWEGEPFISEYIFWEQWSNGFAEIVNPRPLPLDLSDYMIWGGSSNDPAEAITWYAEATGATWLNRFVRYIPGYKWAADSSTWKADPVLAVQDLNVNPIIAAGDVFVMGGIHSTGQAYSVYSSDLASNNPWPSEYQCDVIFNHLSKPNTWDEPVGEYGIRQWTGANIYLYKIVGDSIKEGWKPATDPEDFQLIDVFGHGDGSAWKPGGKQIDMITSCVRKPQFYMGKTGFGESFRGTTPENDSCEWNLFDRNYFDARNVGWPQDILYVGQNLGQHLMDEVTFYKSTVSSLAYKVSVGYSMDEEIRGVTTGTTVDQFKANLIKADPDQSLSVKAVAGGTMLAGTDPVADGDTLIVLSADSTNTSKYVLEVTASGLSNDAVLTSTTYTVEYTGNAGTISDIAFGTTISAVLDAVVVPAGAALNIIDDMDAYAPLKVLNFDSSYTAALATNKIFFEVIAEDGVTEITYALVPTVTASDAYVTSEVFMVDQDGSYIAYVPGGITAPALLKFLVPATGASVKIVDKLGYERTSGDIYKDDRVVVTAADGVTVKVYFLSMLMRDDEILPLYLAYVLSDVYTVDQLGLMISGTITASGTTVSDLLANLTAAPEATAVVVNSNMVEKAGTANLAEGDMVAVTAGDGVTMVYYEVEIDATSVDEIGDASILVYPNPSSGTFYIRGLENGQRVRVFNTLGANILDLPVQQFEEVISLEAQPDGMYFISVSKEDQVIGTFRMIKK
jgi:sulfur carrier protein ThiS